MKIEETNLLMSVLEKAYSQTYRGLSAKQAEEMVAFYHGFFEKYDVSVVVLACKNYIASNKYPPTVAGLQEQINFIMPNSETASDLWVKMQKAICNSAWHSKEEFEKLPESCKRWVGSPRGLQDLSQTETDTLNTVVRGQFLKTIKDVTDRQKAQNELPENMRDFLNGKTAIFLKE